MFDHIQPEWYPQFLPTYQNSKEFAICFRRYCSQRIEQLDGITEIILDFALTIISLTGMSFALKFTSLLLPTIST